MRSSSLNSSSIPAVVWRSGGGGEEETNKQYVLAPSQFFIPFDEELSTTLELEESIIEKEEKEKEALEDEGEKNKQSSNVVEISKIVKNPIMEKPVTIEANEQEDEIVNKVLSVIIKKNKKRNNHEKEENDDSLKKKEKIEKVVPQPPPQQQEEELKKEENNKEDILLPFGISPKLIKIKSPTFERKLNWIDGPPSFNPNIPNIISNSTKKKTLDEEIEEEFDLIIPKYFWNSWYS